MKRLLKALSLVLGIGLSGCAHYQVVRVKEGEDPEGIRYYRPAPYLLVSEAATEQAALAAPATGQAPSAGGKAAIRTAEPVLNYKVEYLPDFNEVYAIQRRGGLGTVDMDIKLAGGWMLTEFGSQTDSKVPEMLTAIAGILPTVLGGLKQQNSFAAPTNGKGTLEPGLYKIEITKTTVKLIRVTEPD
ncbi:hypothetical protein [uncultured Hymenobacter sp.]|uniref:hypothetical protein n=1 Tax=uncultured Hymenobacter sp. TaxID=170016 RepID=UPI0035CA84D2